MKEEWRELEVTTRRKGKEYKLTYLISNLGKVKRPDREIVGRWGTSYILKEKELAHFQMNRGYLKTAAGLVHQLVAKAFIPNPDNLREINHKDGNKLNNRVDNLEWTNHPYNMLHYANSELAARRGYIKPVRVWNTEGKWVGDFISQRQCSEFIGIAQTTLTSYIKNTDSRRFIGKDCYIIRQISYDEYKEKEKKDFPTRRIPKDKRTERHLTRTNNDE